MRHNLRKATAESDRVVDARARLVVACLVMGAALAGCLGGVEPAATSPAAALVAQPPILTVGDYWASKVVQSPDAQAVTMNQTVRVVALDESVIVGGTRQASHLLEKTLTGATGAGPMTRVVRVWERADGTQLRANLTQTVGDGDDASTAYLDVYFGAPCAQMPWPMRLDARLETQCTTYEVSAVSNVTQESFYDIRVEGVESVTVPAGTFEAFRLNFTARFGANNAPVSHTRWWAPAACGEIKSETRQGDRLDARSELLRFSCARPPAATPRP